MADKSAKSGTLAYSLNTGVWREDRMQLLQNATANRNIT